LNFETHPGDSSHHNALIGSHSDADFTLPGIYFDPDCSSQDLDHGVLVIGYGFEGTDADKNKYWLVKNRYKILNITL
jgi:hypothetical protein